MQRNRRNDLSHLIREEMINRFEDVVKEEVRQHNLHIDRQNKQLEEFYLKLSDLENRYGFIVNDHMNYYSKTDGKFNESIKEITKTYEDLTKYISQGRKELDKLHDSFVEKICRLVDKDHLSSELVEINTKIQHMSEKIEEHKKYHSESLHLTNLELVTMCMNISKKQEALEKKVHEDHEALLRQTHEYNVDAQGVLKELQVYKKEVYIQEKKIENLYTLIDRLKGERG